MQKMNENLKASFNKIKEEFDVHLDTINGNTNEINANFENIVKVEQKIDKLSERMDEMQMMLTSLVGEKTEKDMPRFKNINLNTREQEVFLVLYTSEEEMTLLQIAKKLGLTEELVSKYVNTIIIKGVPLIKIYLKNNLYIKIDGSFKDIQAKENVINIAERIYQIIED